MGLCQQKNPKFLFFFVDILTMTGAEFVDRLDFLLKKKNIKRSALYELGVPQQTISNWKKRGNLPTLDIAERIADFFEMSLDELILRTPKTNKKIKELVEKYEALSDRDKRAVDALIASLLSSESESADEIKESAPVYRADKKTPPLSKTAAKTAEEPAPEYAAEKKKGSLEFLDVGEIIMIPCRGITAAGSPIDIYSVPDEYIPFPKKLLPGGNPEDYFFVSLHGVSMTQAGMNDGDYVLIRRCNEPQAGKIMLVQHDGESTLKKIEMDKNGLYRLCWQDGSGRTQTIDSENWSVLGVYCWTIKGWRK